MIDKINPYLVLAIAAGVIAGYILAKRDGGCDCSPRGAVQSPVSLDWQ